MLRGPQTPGELNQRTERLHRFGSTDAVEQALEVLANGSFVARRPRRPGQKEERWAHLLGGEEEARRRSRPLLPPRLARPTRSRTSSASCASCVTRSPSSAPRSSGCASALPADRRHQPVVPGAALERGRRSRLVIQPP